MMAELSDGFIAIPGGWGTWEELFEIVTWGQLGLHRKPIDLLNVRGYFNHLLSFIDHSVAEGFVRREHRALLCVASAPAPLLDALAACEPPAVEKWLDRAST
jgi:hypothetical protein